MHGRRTRAALSAFPAIALLSGCAMWSGDPDGELAGARTLAPGEHHRDSVRCGPAAWLRGADCADWYRAHMPAGGTVQLDVVQLDPAEDAPEFELVLADASGRVLKQMRSRGRQQLRLSRAVGPGPLSFTLRVPEVKRDESTSLDYEIRLSLRRARAGRSRAESRVTSSVLEVERGSDGLNAVLIDKGSSHGMTRGLRGRLVDGGREIGRIEILDVYDEGSRAVVHGALGGAITADTVAELEVP